MFRRELRTGAALLLAALLLSAGAIASGADNAVIAGDGVRVRSQPSVYGDVRGTLDRGARVQVVSRTEFTDTIDGNTAPWFEIVYGEYGGYVFGKYVTLDSGVSVPPTSHSEIYGDPASRFIARGLYRFGKSRTDVIKLLGQPISRVHEKAAGLVIGVDTLTYDGLVIGIWEVEGPKTFVYEVRCTTPAYTFDTLRVGSRLSDVERVLGPPQHIQVPGAEDITYYNLSGFEWATFTVQNGVVVEISFYASPAD